MVSDFQDRFVVNLTDSQSTITILRSQRSDSGTYELSVVPEDLDATTVKDKVKISVKCKYNIFPYFLLETSAIIVLIIIMILNKRVMIFIKRLAVYELLN